MKNVVRLFVQDSPVSVRREGDARLDAVPPGKVLFTPQRWDGGLEARYERGYDKVEPLSTPLTVGAPSWGALNEGRVYLGNLGHDTIAGAREDESEPGEKLDGTGLHAARHVLERAVATGDPRQIHDARQRYRREIEGVKRQRRRLIADARLHSGVSPNRHIVGDGTRAISAGQQNEMNRKFWVSPQTRGAAPTSDSRQSAMRDAAAEALHAPSEQKRIEAIQRGNDALWKRPSPTLR